jgi:transcriptional regulator EpsA
MMNKESFAATDVSESMLRIIESAPQVKRRSQFFLWSQGDIQRWIPHKLLVCGAYERVSQDLVFDVFNSVPLPEGSLAGLIDRREVLLSALLRAWRQGRMQPCCVDLTELPSLPDASLALVQGGYTQVLVHGLCRPGRPDDLESIFVLSAPAQRYNEAELQALEMLLPCLHLTYQRVHQTERQMDTWPGNAPGAGMAPRPSAAQRMITDREREILCWVRDGMNNHQIADKLGISNLTVKNHIQKILRKLGAANRAQAVAKAMTLNALNGGSAQEQALR